MYQDKSIYKGAWKDGKRSGQGELTTALGAQYKGYWSEDQRNGRVMFDW